MDKRATDERGTMRDENGNVLEYTSYNDYCFTCGKSVKTREHERLGHELLSQLPRDTVSDEGE